MGNKKGVLMNYYKLIDLFNFKRNYREFIIVSSILLCFCFLYIPNTLNKKFDYDEFQHAHIAWTLKEGKILYKDTFDHHGPIYAYLISTLWKMFHFKDQADTLIKMRIISLISLIILLILIYLIAQRVFNSLVGLLTLVIILCNKIFYYKGIEIRPDIIQSIFIYSGIYFLVLIILKSKNKYNYFLVGFFWGFALITNFKTAIIVGGCSLFYLIVYFKNIKLVNVAETVFGLLIVIIPIYLFFYLNGAFDDFFYYNYTFNFKAYFIQNVAVMRIYDLKNNIFYNMAWIGLFFFGAYYLFKNKFNKRISVFLILISVFFVLLSWLHFYPQWKLALIPLSSIIPGYGFYSVLKKMDKIANLKFLIFFIAFLFCHLLTNVSHNKTYNILNKEWNNTEQIEFTNYINNLIYEDENIFIIWNIFGGYIFRPHLLYYWFINENQEKIMEDILGYELLGQNLIDQLEKKNCKYLILGDEISYLLKSKYNDSYQYIINNFKPSERYPYFWIR